MVNFFEFLDILNENAEVMVKMLRDVSHAGGMYDSLKAGQIYKATPATNQPNWKEKGLYFVYPDSGPELLLSLDSGDFKIMSDKEFEDAATDNWVKDQEGNDHSDPYVNDFEGR